MSVHGSCSGNESKEAATFMSKRGKRMWQVTLAHNIAPEVTQGTFAHSSLTNASHHVAHLGREV